MPHHISQKLTEESSVDELLDAIAQKVKADPSIDSQQQKSLGHYGWTINQVAEALQVRRETLTIRQLANCATAFRAHVNQRNISKSAKALLPCYRNNIIREAKRLGLFALENEFEQEWQCVRAALKRVAGCPSIVHYAIDRGLHISEFSDAVLEDWSRQKREEKHNYRYVISRKSAFRGAIRRANLAAQFPLLTTEIAPTFRMNARALPRWLRRDLALTIRTMRQEARMDLHRFPWSAAHGLVLRFQEIYGYYKKFKNRRGLPEVHRMNDLISELIVRSYILFLYEDKSWKRQSIRGAVNTIANSLRFHPTLYMADFDWVKDCVQELPEDDDSNIGPNFTGKEIRLDDLATVPGLIRKKALTVSNPRARAWLEVKKFLTFFLVTHPWPAQCLRTCRIKGPKRNLFEGPMPKSGGYALFAELEPAVSEERESWGWQFDFSPVEMRLGRYARGPLVSLLAQKMRGYLAHRAVLLKGKPDPGTLFVNYAGQSFKCAEFGKLVGDICYEHLRVRVTPTEFRQKYLFAWVADEPGDQDNLAAVLWVQWASVSATLTRNQVDVSALGANHAGKWIQRCRLAWKT